MEVMQRKRARGQILRIVREYGVPGISFEGMEQIFRRAGRFGTAMVLEEQVQYLADKGYLTKDLAKDPISGIERWLLHVTAKGIDLLEGSIDHDPGVEIVC